MTMNIDKQKCQQHPEFPGGHPSKYCPGPTLLNFCVRTGTGAFNVVWPLASVQPVNLSCKSNVTTIVSITMQKPS